MWSTSASTGTVTLVPGGITASSFTTSPCSPSEENVAGMHHIASGNFVLDPSTVTLGGGYEIPRLGSSRVALVASADAILNRDTGGATEGSGMILERRPAPLLRASPTGRGSRAPGTTTSSSAASSTPQPSAFLDDDGDLARTVPFAYHARSFVADYQVTRSFGWDAEARRHPRRPGEQRRLYRPAFSADARTTADFVAAEVPARAIRN